MTTKADFNAEEWTTLVEAPLLAGMSVVAAERGGTLKESVAVGRTYAQARQRHGESPLLDEVVASPPAMDPARLREGRGDLPQLAATRLREAAALINAKASADEAQAYKQFAVTVAEAVANAHREGGFAGIGGQPVSDNEQAALDSIRSTLGLAA
jgi:hypothetical protein